MQKIILILIISIGYINAEIAKPWKTKINSLNRLEKFVIVDKGTQRAFVGKYVNTKDDGIYSCKLCGSPLYKSNDKFDSHCGWPSFDDAIKGAIKETIDADGVRIEITCAKCGAHLGHIFRGEKMTPKNVRHCVNSISLDFQKKSSSIQKAYFAGGCFWGVEYYLEKIKGVKSVVSGFMGGDVKNPSYKDVIRGDTGHLESVEVTYDANIVSYEELSRVFFEIHDPTQRDGQGPDIGNQYLSAIFVSNPKQKKVASKLIGLLESKGFKIATKVLDTKRFYPAEDYHQDYYIHKGTKPYCHTRIKRF